MDRGRENKGPEYEIGDLPASLWEGRRRTNRDRIDAGDHRVTWRAFN